MNWGKTLLVTATVAAAGYAAWAAWENSRALRPLAPTPMPEPTTTTSGAATSLQPEFRTTQEEAELQGLLEEDDDGIVTER